ncbi:PID-CTERM protein-sorting domain-containing protein [Hymenobacter convexus]|uniref:PID-CTERM protein-sorting domain-containing protein n=1 Tax=Hymenobacter sp. CA1UV-4 TaxID=3063782 RepID=UPI0027122C84|nr:hypothetical protein [Hymenobacter sp. CA1UV-4]MDO7850966.1 hypothetical protein [Hymenobacter sp. CA1UV-4]
MKALFLAAALTAAASSLALAQGPSTGGPAPGTPAATTDVPLDGGASLLLASGVALGLKKLRQRRRLAR